MVDWGLRPAAVGSRPFIQLFISIPTAVEPTASPRTLARSLLQTLPVQVTLPCSVLCTCRPSCPETIFTLTFPVLQARQVILAVCRKSPGHLPHGLRPLQPVPVRPLSLSSCPLLLEFSTPVRLPDSGLLLPGDLHPSATPLGFPPLWSLPQPSSLGQP